MLALHHLHHLHHLQLTAAPALSRYACALMVLALAGCATEPQKISVPVAVGCVGAVPARPANTFGAGAYPGDKAAAQAALIDAAAWEGYATKLEVIVAGCPAVGAIDARAPGYPSGQNQTVTAEK